MEGYKNLDERNAFHVELDNYLSDTDVTQSLVDASELLFNGDEELNVRSISEINNVLTSLNHGRLSSEIDATISSWANCVLKIKRGDRVISCANGILYFIPN